MPETPAQSQNRVPIELLGARLYPVEPHAAGGWPEVTITLTYTVHTDDQADGEAATREFFERAEWPGDNGR